MFEKDIYQLIRGMRAHKGNEREYILASLRECRKEVRGQDMDQKATALLKLVYLEMFGHDMSWASFNVLEVMSSTKYLQKRVGYLAAVQSFRPDTEVLMLAENLLKKDVNSADKATMALALTAIPHVINPSMANSLLTDLLPRLSHSNPAVRKKTIVTLYRLALVYPETLRPAWPKIKERLLDEGEDTSVTAAVVNVVCELGWRRPQDFLPLAPRLFELLTEGGNNWMAIKIIKLFSTLTPLEPRLVKKLLPPLTSIIKTTPAMSLLYECINGIIQGGIMEAAGGTTEGDEVARLCINKLRAMLVVEGDPNLRYVSLLALAKITSSHDDLVAQHSDVILECIDDGDISIRTRALDLVAGMITPTILPIVVERLLKQLKESGSTSAADEPFNDRGIQEGIVPMADDDEDDARATIQPKTSRSNKKPPLPDDYRTSVIERILEMCSRDTYANLNDFEWYIGVIVDLVKCCPTSLSAAGLGSSTSHLGRPQPNVADAVGAELLNVAVRVKDVRPEAAAAAQALLMVDQREQLFPAVTNSGQGVLSSAAFIAGEYASMLPDPEDVLASLIHSSSAQLSAGVLTSYLQAIPKIFARLTGDDRSPWTVARRDNTTLMIARITHFLEPLNMHPSIEVQERAVEYLDLLRLASEATSQPRISEDEDGYVEPPLLLTQAIPSLFSGAELNPVAPAALRKVPQPESLDLDIPINSNLHMILQQAEYESEYEAGDDAVRKFYHEKPAQRTATDLSSRPAASLLEPPGSSSRSSSYQDTESTSILDPEAAERKKAERRERYRDDPYYIDSSGRTSGASTPMHSILRSGNGGQTFDVDSLPVMELKLDDVRDVASDPERAASSHRVKSATNVAALSSARKAPRRHFEIARDEGLDDDVGGNPGSPSANGNSISMLSSSLPKPSFSATRGAGGVGKRSLLEVDSSGLSALSLSEGGAVAGSKRATQLDYERKRAEDEEMAKAMREVERLRLEMQRAQERIDISGRGGVGGEEEGDEGIVVVKSKKLKKKKTTGGLPDGSASNAMGDAGIEGTNEGEGAVIRKKKKKIKKKDGAEITSSAPDVALTTAAPEDEVPSTGKTKRKKKRQVVFDDGGTV